MTSSARFGAALDRSGVTFRLWAPAAKRVEVMLDRAYPMQRPAQGWYQATIPHARAGTLYKYRIDGELEVPEPPPHFQPQHAFGPRKVLAHHQFQRRSNHCPRPPPHHAPTFTLHR